MTEVVEVSRLRRFLVTFLVILLMRGRYGETKEPPNGVAIRERGCSCGGCDHSEWRALELLKRGAESSLRQEREVGPAVRANPGQGQAKGVTLDQIRRGL